MAGRPQSQRSEATAAQQRSVAYLTQVAQDGSHPRLAGLLGAAPDPVDPVDRYAEVMARVLTGLLGPAPASR